MAALGFTPLPSRLGAVPSAQLPMRLRAPSRLHLEHSFWPTGGDRVGEGHTVLLAVPRWDTWGTAVPPVVKPAWELRAQELPLFLPRLVWSRVAGGASQACKWYGRSAETPLFLLLLAIIICFFICCVPLKQLPVTFYQLNHLPVKFLLC